MPVLAFSPIIVIAHMSAFGISLHLFLHSFPLPVREDIEEKTMRAKRPPQEVSWQPIFQGYSMPTENRHSEQVYRDKQRRRCLY